jgi:hypothetical protein
MSNTWGALSWGQGSWAAQGDVTLTLTSLSLTSSIDSVIITGVIEIGWGGDAWGVNAWGELSGAYVDVSGISLSSNIGSVLTQANSNINPSGIELQIAEPIVVGGTSALIEQQGLSLQTFTGNEDVGIGATVTGSSISSSIDSVTIDPTRLIGEGWGRGFFGEWAWGVNYSVELQSISLSVVTGNEDAFTDVVIDLSGFELSADITPVGTSATSDNEIAHSFLIQTTLEDVSIVGTGLVELTGIALSTAISEVEAGTIQEVPVTGVSATLSIGNEDQSGTAVVSVTGIESTLTLGDAIAESKYEVTGISASFSLGQLNITGSAFVIPNGIGLTANTITPNIIAWAEVDVGTPVTWSPVDLAA